MCNWRKEKGKFEFNVQSTAEQLTAEAAGESNETVDIYRQHRGIMQTGSRQRFS